MLKANVDRRRLLQMLSVGVAAIALTNTYTSSILSTEKKYIVKKKPKIEFFWITKTDNLYQMFKEVGNILIPNIRMLKEYQSAEQEIFIKSMQAGFFNYANDFANCMYKHYGKLNFKNNDIKTQEKLLTNTIKTNPGGWSQIIFLMLTHNPKVLPAYLTSME